MELTMTNNFGFCELNENEMMMVDGGLSVGQCVGLTVAIAACAWAAPIGFAVVSAGLVKVGVGVAVSGAIGLTSAGIIGKITGWY